MPSEAWFWTGVCLWTVAVGWVAGNVISELRSIAASLRRMAQRMEAHERALYDAHERGWDDRGKADAARARQAAMEEEVE